MYGRPWHSSQFLSSTSFSIQPRLASRMITESRSWPRPVKYWSISPFHEFDISLGTFAKPYPGRSAKRSPSSIWKKLINCVQPGLALVLASPLTPISAFSKLDLPTLLRPRNATSASDSCGHCSGLAALIINLGTEAGASAPSVSNFLFPRPRDNLGYRQHSRQRGHFNLALQCDLQHLVHRLDEVELHVVSHDFRNVRQVLLVIRRQNRLANPVAMRRHH